MYIVFLFLQSEQAFPDYEGESFSSVALEHKSIFFGFKMGRIEIPVERPEQKLVMTF